MSTVSKMMSKRDGGVAIGFGLLFFVISLAAGGAIDISNATNQKKRLQDTADASALAAAIAGSDLSAEEYTEIAVDFFQTSELCQRVECPDPEVSVGEGGAVQVAISTTVDTSIMQIFGMPTIPVDVVATALPPNDFGVDVMMVLDYSGSMRWDDKYVAMANAAKDFLDRSEAREGDSMRVGIVPFSEYVLTPMEGRFAYSLADGDNLVGSLVVGCMLNREFPHSVNAETPDEVEIGSLWPMTSYTTGAAGGVGGYDDGLEDPSVETMTVSSLDGSEYIIEFIRVSQNSPFVTPHALWVDEGFMVVDADNDFAVRFKDGVVPGNFSVLNDIPWSSAVLANFNGYGNAADYLNTSDVSLPSDFLAHQLAEQLDPQCGNYAERSLWSRPLSINFPEMRAAIDDMQPLGATNIALALDVGWHYLTPNAPFIEASVSDNTKRAMVLLSDGTQTVRAHGESGAFNIDSANDNIAKTCEGAKESGIEVYTIAFAITDDTTRNLLRNCSSGDSYYHEPTAGNQLEAVFDEIFESISPDKVRITG